MCVCVCVVGGMFRSKKTNGEKGRNRAFFFFLQHACMHACVPPMGSFWSDPVGLVVSRSLFVFR